MMHLCRVNGSDFEMPLEFCDELLSLHPESGITKLLLAGMTTNEATMKIEAYTESPLIQILPQQDRSLQTTSSRSVGEQTVIVVRVLTNGGTQSPTITQEKLRNNIFGNPTDFFRPTVKSQYSKCSNGALSLVPANTGGSFPGVVDVVLSQNWAGIKYDLVAQKVLYDAFSVKYTAAQQATFDHIMFCMPAEMNGDFIAFATLNDNFSYYSDPWCSKLSATMHELGHNMGVLHSGKYGGSEYDDVTCTMGYGYEDESGPSRCFNGKLRLVE